MPVSIRAATPSDAAGIAAIWNPVIRDTAFTFTDQPKSTDEIAALIQARSNAGLGFLVAVDNGVLGFATYSQFRAGPGYAGCMEHSILLAPVAQGTGLGRRLMTALEQHAKACGHRMLIGGVSGSNPKGIGFHAALGYAQVGRIPDAGHKQGRYHDLVLMQKILKAKDGQTAPSAVN